MVKVNKKCLDPHRYNCKYTGKKMVSGYPNNWSDNSVYENPENPQYNDNLNFNYNFPKNINNKDRKYNYLRKNFNDWKQKNPVGTILRYYRWVDRECHLHYVRIIGYNNDNILMRSVVNQ